MAILSFIYTHGIWVSVLACVLSAYLLALCIVGVIRTVRRARLFSVPLLVQSDTEHRIVFMWPHVARVVTYVIGILLADGGVIGSIVLSFLRRG